MTATARDVMAHDVLTIDPEATLDHLEALLMEHRVGGVAVTDAGSLIGVVSRSDIVRVLNLGRALEGYIADGLSTRRGVVDPASRVNLPAEALATLAGKTVRDVMTDGPIAVGPDTAVRDVAREMIAHHVHRIFVTDGDALVGVVSSLDLVGLLAAQQS